MRSRAAVITLAAGAITAAMFVASLTSTGRPAAGATATPTVGPPPQFFQFHPDYAPLRSGPIPYGGNGWSPSEAPQP